jgi:hypothetical protein
VIDVREPLSPQAPAICGRGRWGAQAPLPVACVSPHSPPAYEFNCTFAKRHPEIGERIGANRSAFDGPAVSQTGRANQALRAPTGKRVLVKAPQGTRAHTGHAVAVAVRPGERALKDPLNSTAKRGL